MDKITIQRMGGIAGYGTPNSKIVSRGTVSLDSLNATDRDATTALFQSFGQGLPETQSRDTFWYRVSTSDGGTVDVPEDAVPKVLLDSIHDDFA